MKIVTKECNVKIAKIRQINFTVKFELTLCHHPPQ